MNGPALTAWHREQAAKVAAAHPLTPTTPVRASGNALAASNDEPEPFTEEWLLQSDLAHHRAKVSGAIERQRDEFALDLQVRHQDERGVLR